MTGDGAANAIAAAPGRDADPAGTATTAPGAGVLIVGYGNPLRTDDGVGPAVAARLAGDPRLAGAVILAKHQLVPELAVDVSRAWLLVLVDAADGMAAGDLTVRRLDESTTAAAEADPSMTHHVGPGSLVRLARELFGAAPPVVIVSVGVASFEVGDGLTPAVDAAVPRAARAVIDAVHAAAAEGR
jgi:hydrogenase maturation protease